MLSLKLPKLFVRRRLNGSRDWSSELWKSLKWRHLYCLIQKKSWTVFLARDVWRSYFQDRLLCTGSTSLTPPKYSKVSILSLGQTRIVHVKSEARLTFRSRRANNLKIICCTMTLMLMARLPRHQGRIRTFSINLSLRKTAPGKVCLM